VNTTLGTVVRSTAPNPSLAAVSALVEAATAAAAEPFAAAKNAFRCLERFVVPSDCLLYKVVHALQ
jgi:hypothetical protein